MANFILLLVIASSVISTLWASTIQTAGASGGAILAVGLLVFATCLATIFIAFALEEADTEELSLPILVPTWSIPICASSFAIAGEVSVRTLLAFLNGVVLLTIAVGILRIAIGDRIATVAAIGSLIILAHMLPGA